MLQVLKNTSCSFIILSSLFIRQLPAVQNNILKRCYGGFLIVE
ncbi:hypothetical protein C1G87_0975 [Dehalococcoides mccartyi]|uniref:Uncharacterized protein n=1 Tax=Dehalococcoides mccartyi TaxID=61435 RepID=A0A328EPI1_9CHLR|nr:hypothetical protein C1G87_0975 [Dehalococcoides mccartyi]